MVFLGIALVVMPTVAGLWSFTSVASKVSLLFSNALLTGLILVRFVLVVREPERIRAGLVGADASAVTMAGLVAAIGIKGRRFQADDEATAEYRSRVAGPLVRRTLTLALALGSAGTPQVGDALA